VPGLRWFIRAPVFSVMILKDNMFALGQKQTYAVHNVCFAPESGPHAVHMLMSALGQKQTYALQNGMSALPPKADMCGDPIRSAT
jgi:hypothetical protein